MARLPRVGPKELVLSQAARADLVDIARYTTEAADEATDRNEDRACAQCRSGS